MNIVEAAGQLLPGTAWNLRDGVLEQAEDGTPRVSVPSPADLQRVVDAVAYKDARIKLYPPLQDLADALVHDANGDPAPLAAYIAACNAVKVKYPK